MIAITYMRACKYILGYEITIHNNICILISGYIKSPTGIWRICVLVSEMEMVFSAEISSRSSVISIQKFVGADIPVNSWPSCPNKMADR